ncbi:5'-methylthioadenosine/adenosylhomocysteine nucleosidase [Alkalihalophilus lindianensis]|uniref:adenosylhomocysteine nucleosidase n=1 Tax=Alkalihalophilus lindianensis TaxID=1630542 RepID=A0ABU3XA28_9BACI|nr:5'-methylthioadenosine/adenosylhomocysteine nucleosidase [Alkalihalophilus lindianensis]MDV2684739.1 5'-methylthioadenosine/adenosylhomocysteine nucleosidase [Alkalihalophilus lindianensis]
MKVAVIGAMNEEIERMLTEMEVEETIDYASVRFYKGKMLGRDIVLCKSGVGKVNAALTTQVLIDRFGITHILFTGVAGALDERLDVGDLVISTSAMQHDLDASPLGFKRGEIPMFEGDSDFRASEALLTYAEKAAEGLVDRTVITGRVLSGDQFIADAEQVAELRKTFNGACVEMEGASVAQVATMNKIPFVIIRSISDKANGAASMSFTEFTDIASEQSHILVKSILQQLKG